MDKKPPIYGNKNHTNMLIKSCHTTARTKFSYKRSQVMTRPPKHIEAIRQQTYQSTERNPRNEETKNETPLTN